MCCHSVQGFVETCSPVYIPFIYGVISPGVSVAKVGESGAKLESVAKVGETQLL